MWLFRSGVALPALVLVLSMSPSPARAQKDGGQEVVMVYPGSTPRSFLGVAIVEITSGRARALKLSEERGVEVTRVEEDSPAAKAGLKVQDVVLEYQGQRVEGGEQFVRLVRETPPGRQVKLLVSRNGQAHTLFATIASRRMKTVEIGDTRIAVPHDFEPPRIRIGEISGPPTGVNSPVLGVEAESLNPQLAEFFGVKEGVLVRSVSKGSAAEGSGMRAGDVIVRVGDQKVATPMEVIAALLTNQAHKPAAVSIVREKKSMTLSVNVDEWDGGLPRGRSVRFRD